MPSWRTLRHTWLTRLRDAGMSPEALQAQAGHASIETTRVYSISPTTGWPPSTARRGRDRRPAPPARPMTAPAEARLEGPAVPERWADIDTVAPQLQP